MQQRHGVVVGAKRWAAFQCAIERRAQREHIGGEVRFTAAGDLWSQIGRRAVDHAAAGQGRIAQCPSNPEVADQCRTVLGDQDVAWLHVTVDDANRMSSCQRRRDCCTDLCGFVRLQ
jgi:hypothetical protein